MSKVCRKESLDTVGPEQGPKLQVRANSTFMRTGKLRANGCNEGDLEAVITGTAVWGEIKTGSGQYVESLSSVLLYRNKWSFYLETSVTRKRPGKHKLGLTSFLYQVKEKSYKQEASTGHWFQDPVNTPNPFYKSA